MFSFEFFSEMKVKLVFVSLCCILLLVGGANAHREYDTDPDNSTFDADFDVQVSCPEGQFRANGMCVDEETKVLFDK